MKWTDEMLSIAVGMKRAGFKSKQIAARLGITDRSVRSKMEYMKIKGKLNGKCGVPKQTSALGGTLSSQHFIHIIEQDNEKFTK